MILGEGCDDVDDISDDSSIDNDDDDNVNSIVDDDDYYDDNSVEFEGTSLEEVEIILDKHSSSLSSLVDFYPFESKLTALLYIMLHSPYPIVSQYQERKILINLIIIE